MYCKLDDIYKNWSGITYNRLIKIVIKNHCPFCGKSLRGVPINSKEYCPHCSCKIEQEHKKIQVCRIKKLNIKCEIERMEINYTFYFLTFWEKWLKNYWHFVTRWIDMFTHNLREKSLMGMRKNEGKTQCLYIVFLAQNRFYH